MNLKLNSKLSRHKAKLFSLCGCSIKNMTFLFAGVLFSEQLISAGVEYIVFGETFNHYFDSLFFIFLANVYLYYTNELGEFLLDLNLHAEVVD